MVEVHYKAFAKGLIKELMVYIGMLRIKDCENIMKN